MIRSIVSTFRSSPRLLCGSGINGVFSSQHDHHRGIAKVAKVVYDPWAPTRQPNTFSGGTLPRASHIRKAPLLHQQFIDGKVADGGHTMKHVQYLVMWQGKPLVRDHTNTKNGHAHGVTLEWNTLDQLAATFPWTYNSIKASVAATAESKHSIATPPTVSSTSSLHGIHGCPAVLLGDDHDNNTLKFAVECSTAAPSKDPVGDFHHICPISLFSTSQVLLTQLIYSHQCRLVSILVMFVQQ
jgi:hypothetical protein